MGKYESWMLFLTLDDFSLLLVNQHANSYVLYYTYDYFIADKLPSLWTQTIALSLCVSKQTCR